MKNMMIFPIILMIFACSRAKRYEVKDRRCLEGSCTSQVAGEGANATFNPFKVPNAAEGPWALKFEGGDVDPRTGLRLVKFSWGPLAFAKRYKLNISFDKGCTNTYKSYDILGTFYDQNYEKDVLVDQVATLFACLTASMGDQNEVPAENSPLQLNGNLMSQSKFSLVAPLPRLISSPTKISWTQMPDAAKYEVVLLDGKGTVIREYHDLPPSDTVMSLEIRDLPDGKYRFLLSGIDKKGNKFGSLVGNQLTVYEFVYSQSPKGQWAVLKGIDGINPSARTESVMASVPKGILLWGGTTTQGFSTEGWIFNVTTKIWEKLPSTGQPEPRRGSSVWTGSHLVIWGGRDYNKYTFDYSKNFGDGASYHAADNTWSPLPTIGAPAARYGHTLTSTGANVVIWGGVDRPSLDEKDASTLGDGGILDMKSQVWTPLKGSPLFPRAFHCSVWTGSHLLVFGGISKAAGGDSLMINAGEILDPATMTWKPMNTVGQPSPRFSHSCFWTGKRMLVWGGSSGFMTTANGAQYDPQTDSWSPIEDNNAPFTMRSETALWTGKYLLVWGGGSGSGSFNQLGALYNPETNQWDHLSIVGAPSPRWGTQAVVRDNQVFMYAGDTIYSTDKKGEIYDELYRLTIP